MKSKCFHGLSIWTERVFCEREKEVYFPPETRIKIEYGNGGWKLRPQIFWSHFRAAKKWRNMMLHAGPNQTDRFPIQRHILGISPSSELWFPNSQQDHGLCCFGGPKFDIPGQNSLITCLERVWPDHNGVPKYKACLKGKGKPHLSCKNPWFPGHRFSRKIHLLKKLQSHGAWVDSIFPKLEMRHRWEQRPLPDAGLYS